MTPLELAYTTTASEERAHYEIEFDVREVEVILEGKPIRIPALSYCEDAAEAQLSLRERWLSSVE